MPRWTSKDLDKMILDKLDRKLTLPEQGAGNLLERLRLAKLKLPKAPKV